ncbi:hypothetical protein EYR41_010038 [Orbilia oligospora]|uniref:Heterokaryon incompatibility domain-containing protein n=1 Tax=Orbilia oligospora TaxID=2813651 RepID=A0A8H2DNW7_ORBOL|nr:hypothetical protein EYR41_010038 [Orbilia oligospora]
MSTNHPQCCIHPKTTGWKARLSYNHLTFREPGNHIAESRHNSIRSEIEHQQKKKETLKADRDKLWEKCRNELASLGLNRPEELKDVSKELTKAISQKLGSTEENDATRKKLAAIDEAIYLDNETIEKNEFSLTELRKDIDNLKSAVSTFKEKVKSLEAERDKVEDLDFEDDSDDDSSSDESSSNSDTGINSEDKDGNEDENYNSDEKEEDNGEEFEERTENRNEEEQPGKEKELGNDEDEANEIDIKGQEGVDEKNEGLEGTEEEVLETEEENNLINGQNNIDVGGPSVNPENSTSELKQENETHQKRILKRARKIRKARRRLEDRINSYREYLEDYLEKEAGEAERKAKELEEEIKWAEKKKKKLQNEKTRLSRQLKGLNFKEGRSSSNKITEELKPDGERKDELTKRGERKGVLDRLREKLNTEQSELIKHRFSFQQPDQEPVDTYPEYVYQESNFKRKQEILKKAEDLEDLFRKVRDAKRDFKELQDLIVILTREDFIEEEMRQAPEQKDLLPEKQRSHMLESRPNYKELKKGYVRLLRIWKTKHEHYPLICSLESQALGEDGVNLSEYAALSYFWGSEYPQAYLYLRSDDDNKGTTTPNDSNWGSIARHAIAVPIRANLFRALLRLRSQGENLVWVDYLCINQDDTIEKTSQLREMVKIYGRAKKVCVWLGEPDNQGRSDRAMDFISEVRDFAMLDKYVQDQEKAEEWYGISELMRDRWFSRRWVVQEIALAKDATVHCGSKTVSWPHFVDAVSILVSNQTTIRSLFKSNSWRDGSSTLGEVQFFGANTLIEELDSLFWKAEDGTIIKPVKSLESLVTSLKTFDTSNKRDLIYSLIFIASDTYLGTGGYTPQMIDYNRKIVHVYKDFVEFCIKSAASTTGITRYPLDIICRPWALPITISDTNNADGQVLPSWISLLSNSVFGEPEQVYKGRRNGEAFVGSPGQSRYRASGNMEYIAKFEDAEKEGPSQSPNAPNGVDTATSNCEAPPDNVTSRPFPWNLVVKGFKLAKITKVSPKSTGGLILQESLRMGGWSGIENAREGASVSERIWRTLVANKDARGQVAPTWYQRACFRCLELADNFNGGDLNVGQLRESHSATDARVTKDAGLSSTTTLNKASETPCPSTPTLDVTQNGEKDPPFFTIEKIYGAEGKASKAEKDSELFGLCPGDAEDTDFVCIIYGCSVPLILRHVSPGPVNARYSIIGEAYVHGKMDGEAIHSYISGRTRGTEQDFYLI